MPWLVGSWAFGRVTEAMVLRGVQGGRVLCLQRSAAGCVISCEK